MTEVTILPLTKRFAIAHVKELLFIKNRIPTPLWTEEIFLNDGWGTLDEEGRHRYGKGKWARSWVALIGDEIVGLVLCWEKPGEEGTVLPDSSLYLQSMAVAEGFERRGIGRLLVEQVLADARWNGLLFIDAPERLGVTTETNSAEWNEGVVNFYLACGFEIIGTATIADRTDVVLARAV